MKLSIWLKNKNFTRQSFATRLGVSKSMMTKWCNGGAMPRADAMVMIYRLTGGDVAPNDFYDLPAPANDNLLPCSACANRGDNQHRSA